MINKIQYLIIHGEDGENNFLEVNEYHKEKFDLKSELGFYLGYHYFLEDNGKLIQARKDTEIGAHTIGYNDKSLAICLKGRLDYRQPTINQRHELRLWIEKKMREYNVPVEKVAPHHKFNAQKTCPGKLLTDAEIFEMANWEVREREAKQEEERKKAIMEKQITLLQKVVQFLKELLGIK